MQAHPTSHTTGLALLAFYSIHHSTLPPYQYLPFSPFLGLAINMCERERHFVVCTPPCRVRSKARILDQLKKALRSCSSTCPRAPDVEKEGRRNAGSVAAPACSLVRVRRRAATMHAVNYLKPIKKSLFASVPAKGPRRFHAGRVGGWEPGETLRLSWVGHRRCRAASISCQMA